MRSMQRVLGAALATALLAGAGLGCGRNRVLLDVDVRSFMNENDLVNPYNAPAMLPFQIDIEPFAIDLVEGYQDFGAAESVTLDVELQFDNTSGSGRGVFVLYFGADPSTTFDTQPVGTVEVDLQPGTLATGAAQIQADQRLLDLFTSKQLWMGVHLEVTPQSAEGLSGTCTVSEITAHIVSRMDLF